MSTDTPAAAAGTSEPTDTPAAAAGTSEPGHVIVTEGKASIIFNTQNEVFYNPPQVFNRDLSTLVLRLFAQDRAAEHAARVRKRTTNAHKGEPEAVMEEAVQAALKEAPFEGITVLEALAASGLRSLRYFKEVEGIKSITVNDLDPKAVEAIRRNVEHNGEDPARIIPHQGDAIDVLYRHRQPDDRFDCIDLDPYGTASMFIDGAVQAVADGGLLCVTCTDMAVMCGSYAEVCYSKYGSMPLKSKFCHEMALRILLHTLETSANRYSRYVVPYLSITIDFYIRVFVRVYTQPAEVKKAVDKKSNVYQCMDCGTFHQQAVGRILTRGNSVKFQPGIGPPTGQNCDQCGGRFHFGGPYYSASIHKTDFVERCLGYLDTHPDMYASHKKIYGVLSQIKEEHDIPLFYDLPTMCTTLKCTCPSMPELKSALQRLGYKCTQAYCLATGLKTDAPSDVLWDVLRCWAKQSGAKTLDPTTTAGIMMAKEPKIQADFTILPGTAVKSNHTRYVVNPDFWGPKARAGTNKRKEPPTEKELNKQAGRIKRRQARRPCVRMMKEGDCPKGAECTYSHDKADWPEKFGGPPAGAAKGGAAEGSGSSAGDN